MLKEFPITGFAPTNESIAKCLRDIADYIETDESEIRTIMMVVERIDGTLYRQTIGHPCDYARAVGLLTIASAGGNDRELRGA